MTATRKTLITQLLKGIETGDPKSVEVVNPNQYIQHNPQTQEGGEGLAALFKRLSKTSPKVNIVRIFSDGDYVFGHTEYDFGSPRVGFEVFRFEGEQTVEHWDNIQPRQGPNLAGHSMVSGETKVCDLEHTEANRTLVRTFTEQVLMAGAVSKLSDFVAASYIEHHPNRADGIAALRATVQATSQAKNNTTRYTTLHRVLAEGNFVLTVCEGYRAEQHTSFYDLYRVADGRIVEHWNTVETVPPQSEWENDNGKF